MAHFPLHFVGAKLTVGIVLGIVDGDVERVGAKLGLPEVSLHFFPLHFVGAKLTVGTLDGTLLGTVLKLKVGMIDDSALGSSEGN